MRLETQLGYTYTRLALRRLWMPAQSPETQCNTAVKHIGAHSFIKFQRWVVSSDAVITDISSFRDTYL